MKYLKIVNNGVLEMELIALMGGTTKANDVYKIGQFGTGLKYTLAFLLRNNIDFHIFCGLQKVAITVNPKVIRGETFEKIWINGEATSITTNMGIDWRAWMIIREVWCNALDEGGAERSFSSDPCGEPGKTSFYIQVDAQIQEVLNQWSKYFIHDQIPWSESSLYRIYPGGDSLRLYKNGVLIEEKAEKSLFAYDILCAPLNELREYKGHLVYDVSQALFHANEKVADYFLNNITDEYYEAAMSYDWYSCRWGDAWKNVLGNAKLIHPEALEALRKLGREITEGAYVVVPKGVFKALTKQFQHVSALTISEKIGEFFPDDSPEAQNRLNQGLVILEACGHPMHPALTFHFGYFGDKNVFARVDQNTKKVYISNTIIHATLTTIVAMLLEENAHFLTGFADCSREFQQYWINLFAHELLARHKIEI